MENEKRYMKDLESWVRQVWMLPNLDDKKLIALDLIDNMEFKNKAHLFSHKINNTNSCQVIDKLVTDILLSGEGLKCI